MIVNDYACPECGYDGPHIVLSREGSGTLVECGDIECAAEFDAAMPDLPERP